MLRDKGFLFEMRELAEKSMEWKVKLLSFPAN